jgi:SPP1 gp7 family putative phage head morphogenesis protein
MFNVSADTLEFVQAIAFFRKKLAMSAKDYYALEDEARKKAFTVSGVAQLDIIQQVYAATKKAVEKGTGWEVFKKDVQKSLESAWGQSDVVTGWRVENIFRTNVQGAYSAGRYEQQTDEDVLKERPWWYYDAFIDGQTSDICRGYNGTLLRATDPFWQKAYPPNHFACRSAVQALTEKEAEARGGATKVPTASPQAGFDTVPGTPYKPDLNKYDSDLSELAKDKLDPQPITNPERLKEVKGDVRKNLERYAAKFEEAWTQVELKDIDPEPLGEVVAQYNPKTGRIEVNLKASFWDDPEGAIKKEFEFGYYSTGDPWHIVHHEWAHARLHRTPGIFNRTLKPLPDEYQEIARRVSVRATQETTQEFLAEVYAMLRVMDAKDIPEDILKAYKKLGGDFISLRAREDNASIAST